jgi:hypothetical protein
MQPVQEVARASLAKLLEDKLGLQDARRFSEEHLDSLIQKGYTDTSTLGDASREGLREPPALPSALVDKLLKAFHSQGEDWLHTELVSVSSAEPSSGMHCVGNLLAGVGSTVEVHLLLVALAKSPALSVQIV